jgi:hypothetical protein
MFYHYTDRTWVRSGDIPNGSLFELSMTSADEGWASGVEGADGSILFHYERGLWSPLAIPAHTRVYEVAAVGPGDI